MAKSIKNGSTRFHSDNYHVSFGIQKWLVKKGYVLSAKNAMQVDDTEYSQLLRDFAVHDNKDFDFSKVKNQITLERYVDRRFPKFCQFCVNRFKVVTV